MVETVIMEAEDIRRSLNRISHEIMEKHRDLNGLLLVGIRTRGVPLAARIAANIDEWDGVNIPTGALDISLHRDDLDSAPMGPPVLNTEIPVDIDGWGVVLVDDVLFTGRTIRAALDAMTQLGRPRRVQLAVLVDRGHRELPIRADYVGKNIPTSRSESVKVHLTETDGRDEVVLLHQGVRASAGRTGA